MMPLRPASWPPCYPNPGQPTDSLVILSHWYTQMSPLCSLYSLTTGGYWDFNVNPWALTGRGLFTAPFCLQNQQGQV